jgi:hypothetical protein
MTAGAKRRKSRKGNRSMKIKAIAAAAALLVLGWTATPGFAVDANDDGLPDDPMSNENTIPGPETDTPSDPAADDSPAARVPTGGCKERIREVQVSSWQKGDTHPLEPQPEFVF